MYFSVFLAIIPSSKQYWYFKMTTFKTEHLTGSLKTLIEGTNEHLKSLARICSSEVKETVDGKLKHLSNCVVKVQPVQSEEPFYLYGNKHKTLITNKLIIKEALYDKETFEISEGDTIYEGLISDEQLLNSLMLDTGNTNPMTTTQVGCFKLGKPTKSLYKKTLDSAKDNLIEDFEFNKESFYQGVDLLKEEMKKARPSSKNIGRAKISISSSIHKLHIDLTEHLKELAESMKKDSNSLKTEIVSTLEKLAFYKGASLILEDKRDIALKDDLVTWLFKGFDEEKNKTLIEFFNQAIKSNKNEDNKLHDIKQILAHLNKIEEIGSTNLYQAGLDITRTMGSQPLVNSTNIQQSFFSLKISLAKHRSSYDNNFSYMASSEFLRIAIPYNDLIFLLRGTKDTDYVVGTIFRFFNNGVPCVNIKQSAAAKVGSKYKLKDADPAISSKYDKICQMLEQKMDKENKVKIISEIDELESLFDRVHEKIILNGVNSQEELHDIVLNEIQESIQKEYQSLPRSLIDKSIKLLK